ncbi:MAG: hypothetical protein LAT75_15060 [Candidatus Cyclonatronum sp.]|uniref:hypothetical protein n=1 Tax=Cyclonatronum sp. TaxID=3024185 RepID=UPI0025C6EFAB|nr:hypothetical protein [Cyclonatronum sp.]MCH8488181.1 hypothetical protein [Cyclonatronum sp.]
MDTNILNALIVTIAGLVSGVIGYFIREYQNRANNFFNVYLISSTTKRGDKIKIDLDVRSKIEESNLFKKVKEEAEFGDIYDNWDLADDLKRIWKKIEVILINSHSIVDEDEYFDCIADVFEFRNFDYWMKRFLIRNIVDNLKVTREKKLIKINTIDKDGDCYIEFPKKNVSFNVGENPAIQSKSEILLNNLSEKNIINLKKLFNEFRQFMVHEYEISLAILDKLIDIKNKQSRWLLYVTVSNISKYPLLFGLYPVLNIHHNKNTYPSNMYIATINEKGIISDTFKPVLVKPNETLDLAIITKDIERESENGAIIRGVFEKKIGKLSIKWNVIRPGLFQNQIITSRKQKISDCHIA